MVLFKFYLMPDRMFNLFNRRQNLCPTWFMWPLCLAAWQRRWVQRHATHSLEVAVCWRKPRIFRREPLLTQPANINCNAYPFQSPKIRLQFKPQWDTPSSHRSFSCISISLLDDVIICIVNRYNRFWRPNHDTHTQRTNNSYNNLEYPEICAF